MKIAISAMEEVSHPHFKGGEKSAEMRMFFDGANRIMKGRLTPGASIGEHTHETNSEILYVLQGNPVAICDGVEEPLQPGDCHYCEKGHTHTLINRGSEDVIFFAVVPEA
ncbi:MAG: cupin domain-containing protein [Bacteroidaceae bacterium]|nr:cupin domain-containing protein [Bacteroidaceae bacterium]